MRFGISSKKVSPSRIPTKKLQGTFTTYCMQNILLSVHDSQNSLCAKAQGNFEANILTMKSDIQNFHRGLMDWKKVRICGVRSLQYD